MTERIAARPEKAALAAAVGDVLELTVGEVVHGGWCIARLDESAESKLVLFIRHALPGERVRARITQVNAKLARADAVEILTAAPARVRPPCPHAAPGGCGGCDWQHVSLAAQRELKAVVISQQLKRIAGIERAVTVEPLPGDEPGDGPGDGSQAGLGWRTRVKFTVGSDGVAGLHQHRSHAIVPVGDCLIAHSLVRQADVTRQRWRGASSVDVAVAPAAAGRAIMVHPAAPARGQRDPALARGQRDSGPARGQRGPAHRESGQRGPAYRESGHPKPTEPDGGYLTQRAAGRDWRVAASGFWQVHPAAADTLTDAVLAALQPGPGDTALDLFCGAGLFAGALADAVGPTGGVIAVESDEIAVRDARRNLRDTSWARIFRGDAADVIGRLGTNHARIAVVDPPRTGLDRPLIDLLSTAPGLRLIGYLSCDPATLARDLAIFGDNGCELIDLRAFDAFPMTHHVECLAVLQPPAG